MDTKPSLSKAVLLTLGIALMLPVATSWQDMAGSVHKTIGGSITADSAEVEKARLEEQMQQMQEQIAKLTDLIEKLDQQ